MRWFFGVLSFLIISITLIAACATPSATPAPTTPIPATKSTGTPTPTTPAPKPTTPAATPKPVTLDFTTHVQPGQVTLDDGILKWVDNVSKRTNGQVKIKVYDSETLFPQAQTWDAVALGKVDSGFVPDTISTAKEPILGWVESYYFKFKDYQHEKRIMDAGMLDITGAAFEKHNMKLIATLLSSSLGFGNSKRTIKLPDDMKGLKMRVYNPQLTALTKKAGGIPLNVSGSEMYQAMQRGTTDGYYTAVQTAVLYSLFEVAKYFTNTFMKASTLSITVNLDTWKNKLNDEQRKILLDAGKEATDWEVNKLVAEHNGYISALRGKGVNVYDLTPEEFKQWETFSGFLQDDYRKQIGDDLANKIAKIIQTAN